MVGLSGSRNIIVIFIVSTGIITFADFSAASIPMLNMNVFVKVAEISTGIPLFILNKLTMLHMPCLCHCH